MKQFHSAATGNVAPFIFHAYVPDFEGYSYELEVQRYLSKTTPAISEKEMKHSFLNILRACLPGGYLK